MTCYNRLMRPLRILLVDDHAVVRTGLSTLLSRQANYSIVGEAATENEAVEQALKVTPDIVLMDIRLKEGSGIDACRQIMQKLPETKVVMLTSFAEDDLLFAAIRAGAVGYILKQASNNDLIRAIQSAAEGQGALDPSLTQRVFDQVRQSITQAEQSAFDQLTTQEMQILAHIVKGETNRQIAALMHLSAGTVRNYVSNIFSKLQLANRAEAAAYAVDHHLQDFL